MIIQRKKCFLRLLFVCMLFIPGIYQHAQAQNITLKADRNSILIGEPIRIELSWAVNHAIPDLPALISDSMPHFEWLDSVQIDSVISGTQYRYIFTGTLTSYDSGRHAIGPWIMKDPLNGTIQRTDSIWMDVYYMPEDASGNLRDIKPILTDDTAPLNYRKWIVAGLFLLLALAALMYWIKRKKPATALQADGRTALQKLQSGLMELEKMPLHTREDFRHYHSGLHAVLKTYLTELTGITHHSDSSSDLILFFKQAGLDQHGLTSIANIVRTGDAVLFAKYLPEESASRPMAMELWRLVQASNIPNIPAKEKNV